MISDRLQLELDVHNEKTSRLHAESELNTEQMKTQSMQMENINMIEVKLLSKSHDCCFLDIKRR